MSSTTRTDLKDRLANRAGAVTTTTQAEPPRTLAQQLEAMVPQFARAMPKHMKADRLARIALTEYRRNPALAECSPQSFFGALMQAAQLGLEPGLVGHCYLVPYRNRHTGTREVQFQIGYKGMLELVRRSGEVMGSPKARLVYANDLFELRHTLEGDVFSHTPWYLREDRQVESGALRGGYVQVRYNAGSGDVFYLPLAEIEKRRARSLAKDSGPWKTDYEAMCLKTVVRAAFTWLPVSIEWQQRFIEAEESVTRIDPASLDVSVQAAWETQGEVVDPQTGEVLPAATQEAGQPNGELALTP